MRRQVRIGYVPQEPSFSTEHRRSRKRSPRSCSTKVWTPMTQRPHVHGPQPGRASSARPVHRHALRRMEETSGHRPVVDAGAGRSADGRTDQPFGCRGNTLAGTIVTGRSPAFLVVSHDRRFLEAVTSRMIWELNRSYPTGVFEAKGRYSDFLEQRDAALHAQANYEASLANRVRREVEWLRRGPKARTTKAKARIDSAGRLIDELHTIEARQAQGTAGINFTASGRKSKRFGRGHAALQIAWREADRQGYRLASWTGRTNRVAWPQRKRKEHSAEVAGRHSATGYRNHHPRRPAARGHLRATPRITGSASSLRRSLAPRATPSSIKTGRSI